MGLDPEEYKNRRRARAQKREKDRKRNRALAIRLGIAAAVLVVCGVIIAIVVSSGKDKPAAPDTTPAASQTQESGTTEDSGKETVIHIAAAGDLNVNDTLIAAGGGGLDFTNAFADVAYLLADADVTALNFEGVLCGEPFGESRSAPLSLMHSLSAAGVDMIQLANSYSIHRGVSGLSETIDSIRVVGMEPLGVSTDRSAYQNTKGYTICDVNGVRIAFVAFTKGMDGMALPAGSENAVNLLYTDYASTYQHVNTEGITRLLNAVQEEHPDLTVAMLHWGSEYNDTVSASQEEIRDLMWSCGVNVIIGSHPHFVQKMELDRENNRFIAYSLGDFASDAKRSGTEYSVILDLTVTKNNRTGKAAVTGYSYTPIFSVVEKDRPLRVMRIREAMKGHELSHVEQVSQKTYEQMQYALERIDSRVKGE